MTDKRTTPGVIIASVALLISMSLTCHGAATAQEKELKRFGFYSNETSSAGEHSDGYTLRLWIRHGSLFGLLKQHEGLIGDGPEGLLSDIKYDKKTGKIAFNARVYYCINSNGINWNIHFEGHITNKKVVGLLSSDAPSAEKRQVVLSRCCEDAPLFKDYGTYETWKSDWLDLPPCN